MKHKLSKAPHDMIVDTQFSYFLVGRFIFEEAGYTVYVISEYMHIGPSDVNMVFQITKADYLNFLEMSRQELTPSVAELKDAMKNFLCGETIHCVRNSCVLEDIDLALGEKIPTL